MTFRIICFDGGGIRGLITALLLRDLFSDDGIAEEPDMFSGTSTGSFIALGLANGMTVNDVVALYNDGGTFFHVTDFCWDCVWQELGITDEASKAKIRSGDLSELGGDIRDIIAKIKNIFVAAYDTTALAPALEQRLGSGPLSGLGKHAAVNTLQLWHPHKDDPMPMQISDMPSGQWRARTIGTATDDEFSAMQVWQAALCSGAAPTYFPPYQPTGFSSYFADGGMFANNPAASAISYALQHGWTRLEDIRMLSIGTGHTNLGIPPEVIGDPQCWGGWQWMKPSSRDGGIVPAMPLVEAALSASADACGEYASMMLGKGDVGLGGRYWRLNCDLEQAIGLADWEKIPEMRTIVEDFIKSEPYQQWRKAFLTFWQS